MRKPRDEKRKAPVPFPRAPLRKDGQRVEPRRSMENRTESLERLSALAATVAADLQEHEAVRDELETAEAALLDKLLARVKPALPALCSKLVKRDRNYYVQAGKRGHDIEHHAERGVILAGDGPTRKQRTEHGGTYEGVHLALLESGSWGELVYAGSWSKRGTQSDSDTRKNTLRVMDSRTVAHEWHVDEIIEGLDEALEKQATDTRKKRTEELRERLAAVVALVKPA